MCRIAIIYQGMPFLEELLTELIKANGGEGNGLGYFTPDGFPVLHKGVALTAKDICSLLPKDTYGLFHTRKASVGNISDDNCQPILIDRDTFLVHNGTWSDHKLARMAMLLQKQIDVAEFQNLSDTVILSKIIQVVGLSFLDLVDSGVFILFRKGAIRVYLHTGNFNAMRYHGWWFYATDFPSELYKTRTVTLNFTNGSVFDISPQGFKLLKGKTLKTYTSLFNRTNIEPKIPNYEEDFFDVPALL